MAYPTTTVEISFVSGPYIASPTWVNVTTYVREITTRRGRSNELQSFETGTATITLNNRDRRFDPMNTAGPYYGNLTPRRQVRITATANSITKTIYRGYIAGWPVEITDAGFDSTVTLECFDALGLLAQEELPDDLAEAKIKELGAYRYWPLTDPIDPDNYTTQTLKEWQNRANLVPTPGVRTSNGDGLAIGIPDTCVSLSETEFSPGWSTTAALETASYSTVFLVWFELGSGDANWIFAAYGVRNEVELAYDKTNSHLYVYTYNGTIQSTYRATIYLDVSIPHHIAVSTTAAAALTLVVLDGQIENLTLIGTTPWTDPMSNNYQVTPGRHQQAAIFFQLSNLQSPPLIEIYKLGVNRLTESVYNRLLRLETLTSFPSSMIETDIIPTRVQRTNLVSNPNFETNTTGWGVSASTTLARSTLEAYSGASSGLVTFTNTAAASGINNLGSRGPATAGLSYTGSCYAKMGTGTAFTYWIRLFFYDIGGNILSAPLSTITALGTNWERKSLTAIAPANTATVGIQIARDTALTGTASCYLDAILVEQASSALPYFDGSFSDPYEQYNLQSQSWTGTANASTSVAYYDQSSPYRMVAEFTTGGPDLASELQLLSDSEGGNLFTKADGTIFLSSRLSFSTGTSFTSQATFGGAGITIGPSINYSLDADTMRNALTMTYSGDGSSETTDTTSIAAYGQQGGSWSTQLASQEAADELGTMLVNFAKDPKLVISPIEVNVAGDTASWGTIIGLELLNRITLNIVPRTGSTITTSQLIQSIEHRITPSQWVSTINGSVRYTNVFTIGSSLIGGTDLIA